MTVPVYERLGVRPIINARGMNTMASGSLMPKPVLEAMTEAATAFVDMAELNARAGEHIARLIGVEAAHVTSGSAGGLLLAAAAVHRRHGPRADPAPPRHGRHAERDRDPAVRPHPLRPVPADGRGAARDRGRGGRAAARPRSRRRSASGPPRSSTSSPPAWPTAAWAPSAWPPSRTPTASRSIVDAASTLPPSGHLTRWTGRGADLVIYSGGKGIRGPQNTGLLLGRADLVRAAAANAAPNSAIGRPCKVSKEAIVGLVTALELFLQDDHRVEWDRHLDEARRIAAAAAGLPGVRVTVEDDPAVWTAPTVLVALDEAATGRTPATVEAALRAGDPPIMVRPFQGQVLIDPHCLRGDEASVVARRLREALTAPR